MQIEKFLVTRYVLSAPRNSPSVAATAFAARLFHYTRGAEEEKRARARASVGQIEKFLAVKREEVPFTTPPPLCVRARVYGFIKRCVTPGLGVIYRWVAMVFN